MSVGSACTHCIWIAQWRGSTCIGEVSISQSCRRTCSYSCCCKINGGRSTNCCRSNGDYIRLRIDGYRYRCRIRTTSGQGTYDVVGSACTHCIWIAQWRGSTCIGEVSISQSCRRTCSYSCCCKINGGRSTNCCRSNGDYIRLRIDGYRYRCRIRTTSGQGTYDVVGSACTHCIWIAQWRGSTCIGEVSISQSCRRTCSYSCCCKINGGRSTNCCRSNGDYIRLRIDGYRYRCRIRTTSGQGTYDVVGSACTHCIWIAQWRGSTCIGEVSISQSCRRTCSYSCCCKINGGRSTNCCRSNGDYIRLRIDGYRYRCRIRTTSGQGTYDVVGSACTHCIWIAQWRGSTCIGEVSISQSCRRTCSYSCCCKINGGRSTNCCRSNGDYIRLRIDGYRYRCRIRTTSGQGTYDVVGSACTHCIWIAQWRGSTCIGEVSISQSCRRTCSYSCCCKINGGRSTNCCRSNGDYIRLRIDGYRYRCRIRTTSGQGTYDVVGSACTHCIWIAQWRGSTCIGEVSISQSCRRTCSYSCCCKINGGRSTNCCRSNGDYIRLRIDGYRYRCRIRTTSGQGTYDVVGSACTHCIWIAQWRGSTCIGEVSISQSCRRTCSYSCCCKINGGRSTNCCRSNGDYIRLRIDGYRYRCRIRTTSGQGTYDVVGSACNHCIWIAQWRGSTCIGEVSISQSCRRTCSYSCCCKINGGQAQTAAGATVITSGLGLTDDGARPAPCSRPSCSASPTTSRSCWASSARRSRAS